MKVKEKEINKILEKAVSRIKKELKPLVIIQFGSSLKPENMLVESDIDILAVRSKGKRDVKVFNYGIEVSVQIISKKDFLLALKSGNPVAFSAVNFGKALYDPKNLMKNFKKASKLTAKTVEILYKDGWSAFSRAILEYFSRNCAGCYLKYCHHSARNFLKALVLKKRGIFCQYDSELLANLPKTIAKSYKKLIAYRKKGDKFPFSLIVEKMFNDREAEPLLATEKIVRHCVKQLKGKKVKTLKQLVKGVKGRINEIFLGSEGEALILVTRKIRKRLFS